MLDRGCLVLLVGVAMFASVSADDRRLSTDLEPIFYKLNIEPFMKEAYFEGELILRFKAVEKTDRIILNAKDLEFDKTSISLEDSRANSVRIYSIKVDDELQTLTIRSAVAFVPGKEYDLSISYTGKINKDPIGLYTNTYIDDVEQSLLAVTQLRPVYARRVFPCFDEPTFRANFLISIRHLRNEYAISNMPVLSIQNKGHNKTLTTFQETPKIPTFLVALMVSKLPMVKNGDFASYSVPKKIEGAKYSAQIGPRVAQAMENHINLPYQQSKTDLVALPLLGPVAMENWGLFTFRENNILYFEDLSKTKQKQNVPRFIAHEVAHAWMGNPVTIGWWDYLWLSEAFAMYYEYYIPDLIEPSWKMLDQLVVELHQAGLLADSLPTAPLTTTVSTPEEIIAKFSGVTYSKGPALLRMVIHTITERQFLKGLKKFFVDNAYSSITPDNFWNSLNNKTSLPSSLKNIMYNWTTESGYPMITVVRNNGMIHLTQNTFKLNNKQRCDDRQWWIPLTYTTSAECDFTSTSPQLWFYPKKSHKFEMPLDDDEWIIFNIQSTGFYRVNYDGRNWRNIIKQLQNDPTKIHTLNRAQLLDDSLNLARSGCLEYEITLDLAKYLMGENQYIPWYSALTGFSFLNDILFHSPLYNDFKVYMTSLLENIYKEVGFNKKTGEPHLKRLTREIIVKWACDMGIKDCTDRSVSYIASLGPRIKPQRISSDVRETALCTGIAEGGFREWQSILLLFKTSIPEDRIIYLSALGCSRNSSNINEFLSGSVSKLSEKDWYERYSGIVRKENAEILLDYIIRNVHSLKIRFGVENVIKYVNLIGRFLTTKEHAKKLLDLEKRTPNLGSVREGVLSRAEWVEVNSAQLSNYFKGSW